MTEKWKKRIYKFWKGWGCSIFIALLIATSFRSAIADWNDVPTGSMKPTILEGDRIFVNKLAYDLKVPYTTWHITRWDDPKRGDIVVFFSPKDGTRMVKRVIGLPGDTIALAENRLFINGESADYESLDPETIPGFADKIDPNDVFYREKLNGKKHAMMLMPKKYARRSFSPVVIPVGHYLMLGDNRDNSADSRFFGLVDRKKIVGRAVGVALSLKMDDHYLPRWSRFFKKLL